MNKDILKKFLNHSIAKSDGIINISILDVDTKEANTQEEFDKLDSVLDSAYEEIKKELIRDGHKLKRESEVYCIFENKDDYTELFILQNKDTCVTLIELI